MLDLFEILRRSEEGPYIEEKEFDKLVFRKAKELVKDYGIKFDRDNIIPTDNSLIKDIFEAGFKLALETGLYVIENRRVIKLSEEELKYEILNTPPEIIVGEGRDSRVLYARKIEDQRRPLIMGGQAGAPIPEEFYYEMAISYMKEPLIDFINHGGLARVRGIDVRTRSPAEALATIYELLYLRKAALATGRPGIHLLAGESSVSAIGDLAIQKPELIRKTDAHLVPILNDLKTDYDRLTKAFTFKIYGGFNVTLVDPVIGGFLGGPEGVAIGFIASFLLGRAIYGSDYHVIHPIHPKYVSTTAPECLWLLSVVSQAMAKFTNFILMGDVWTSNGAGSRNIFHEIVANTITVAVSGSHPLGVSATNGKYPNASGLETRFMAEIAIASTRLNREDANDIVKIFLKMYYPEKMEKPDVGKSFPELYDIKTITPRDWWYKLYQEALKEIENYGLKTRSL